MPHVLHIFGRHGDPRPDEVSPEDVLSIHTPLPPEHVDGVEEPPTVHRVLEAKIPKPNSAVIDLALCSRDLPEIVTIMRDCTEVHIYRLEPYLALHLIPYVPPRYLEQTPMIVHGNWNELQRELTYDATRYEKWPGPILYDELAAEQAGVTDPEKIVAGPCLQVDYLRAELQPHPQAARPFAIDDGPYVALIAFSSQLTEETQALFRDKLQSSQFNASLGPAAAKLSLDILKDLPTDSEATALGSPKNHRSLRPIQALVIPVGTHPSTLTHVEALQAIAQGIPIVCLGSKPSDAPQHTTWIDPEEVNVIDAVADLIHEWATTSWCYGKAAPVDTNSARQWLLERVVPAA